MKRMIVAVMAILVLGSCGLFTPANSTALNDSLAQARQDIAQMKAAAAAATQPMVVTPATATQPAVTIAPPPQVVKAAEKVQADLSKTDQPLAAAQAVATAAMQPGANPGTMVTAIAPLTGSAAPWVLLGGTVLGMLWQYNQSQKQKQALAGIQDGLSAAIKTKAITVSPDAATVVNAAVPAHPAADKVVDLLTDASGQPRIP